MYIQTAQASSIQLGIFSINMQQNIYIYIYIHIAIYVPKLICAPITAVIIN